MTRTLGAIALAGVAVLGFAASSETPRADAISAPTAVALQVEAPLGYLTFTVSSDAAWVDVEVYERDAPGRARHLTFYDPVAGPDGTTTVTLTQLPVGVVMCATLSAVSYGQWGPDPAGSGYEFSSTSNVVCSDG